MYKKFKIILTAAIKNFENWSKILQVWVFCSVVAFTFTPKRNLLKKSKHKINLIIPIIFRFLEDQYL